MRDTVGMPAPLDPYRTLGLAPGASADEIRRAYRQLAKANHPDSAGEAALPRFLAIQTAYEMLITGATARPACGAGTRGARTPARARRRPVRARRQRGLRGVAATGTAGGQAPEPGGRIGRGRIRASGGPASPAMAAPAGTAAVASHGPPGARANGRGAPGGRSRSPNKATLGSTSYDAAEDEPFEPDWSGGTWYGASSGTYWTINPKEYADPRKHGPEYQRRARRMIDGVDVDTTDEGPAIAGDDFTDADTETATGGPGRSRFDGRWTYPDERARGPRALGRARRRRHGAAGRRRSTNRPGRRSRRCSTASSAGRSASGAGSSSRSSGWLPIGAGIAWLAGELTGCGRFTATCVDPSGIGTLIPQLAVIVVLAAVPWLAAISRRPAPLAALLVSVAVAVVLSAAGGSRQPGVSNVVIALVFVVGYVAGAAFAAGRKLGWRRVP